MSTPSPGSTSATSYGTDKGAYIEHIRGLQNAYPALKAFLRKLEDTNDEGQCQVEQLYAKCHSGRLPGRCTLLLFEERQVSAQEFATPEELDCYVQCPPAGKTSPQCRLWILEDLHLAWVRVLGKHLGVDPTVFSEQTNTFHFTDSDTIPSRSLPSMVRPNKSFTLRYYELRRLLDPSAISVMKNQMTFAANRRRYERWRDIDTTSLQKMGRPRHGFVRRCASFWTNQRPGRQGWDAVMLVDPAFNSVPWQEPGARKACTILQDPTKYDSLADLWKARSWRYPGSVRPTMDSSVSYHEGPSTLSDIPLISDDEACQLEALEVNAQRNRSSPLDEMVFYWTKIAKSDLISAARDQSCNSAHFLIKYIAQFWNDQLELIACGVAESEYYADDHQASIDSESSGDAWRNELQDIDNTTQDINYQKRQLMHFDQALILNLERLGQVIGHECISDDFSEALRDAQRDFLNIRNRLIPYVERVAGLGNVANDLASLHTAYRSIRSGEYGLRLSLLASFVFPMTLVTSMLSMADDFLPGKGRFWVFWAASVPLVCLLAALLLLGRKPYQQLNQALEASKRGRRKRTDQQG